jgi:hypothetical protein
VPGERVVDVDGAGVQRFDKGQVAVDETVDETLGVLGQIVRVDDCGPFKRAAALRP